MGLKYNYFGHNWKQMMCYHMSFVSICVNIDPKGCKLTFQVNGYFFLPWAQVKVLKW